MNAPIVEPIRNETRPQRGTPQMSSPAPTVAPATPRRMLGVRLPPEGEGGLFSQSWFPICMSKDVERGQVKGYDFLDGRVIVMRGEDGVARVMSAYCPHLGADLSVGQVIGDTVRCAFHHWQYDGGGRCVRTAVGDPAPPTARLFRFPTVERYGIVFAFNGEEPLFELPTFDHPDDELLWYSECYPTDFPVDPWVICCNTPDVQHIRVLHNIAFDAEDQVRTPSGPSIPCSTISPARTHWASASIFASAFTAPAFSIKAARCRGAGSDS